MKRVTTIVSIALFYLKDQPVFTYLEMSSILHFNVRLPNLTPNFSATFVVSYRKCDRTVHVLSTGDLQHIGYVNLVFVDLIAQCVSLIRSLRFSDLYVLKQNLVEDCKLATT